MNKRAVIILSIAIVSALAVIGFFIYRASVARGMEVEVIPPPRVLIGVPFDVRVAIANKSSNIFKNARLTLKLPPGVALVGAPTSQDSVSQDLNTLSGGASGEQTFKLIALSDENTFKKITADVSYQAGAFQSNFDKGVDKNITVGGHGVLLDIGAPQKILNGQPFETEISFKNVSDTNMDDLKLKLDYPPTFTLAGSTLPPDIGNDTWVLGNLKKGSEIKFKVTGSVVGPEGAFLDSAATVEALLAGQLYPINQNAATIAITPAPIALKIDLNDNNEYVAEPGSDLHYTLNYANNTDVSLRDLIIRAKLSGDMYDLSTLTTNGTFRSSDNTVTWTAANVPGLISLAPSQPGSVYFDIRAKRNYPIKKSDDKNFLLKVSASIDSPTVPYFVAEGKTENFASIENKVRGSIALDAKAFFRDPVSGITNKGPMPLRLDEPTNFTVHWQIAAYAADMNNIEVRAFLGGNVRATGIVKSNAATIPTYNERTQEMVWKIPKIQANWGVLGKPVEAIFQVEAIPSINELDRPMLLIQKSALKATDEFTGLDLSAEDAGITTQSLDDPTVRGQGTVVQQPQMLQLQQNQESERQALLRLLAQQQASRDQQDEQLAALEDRQSAEQRQLDALLKKQILYYYPPSEDVPVPDITDDGSAVADSSCVDQAAEDRDNELKAVDENRSDDLRTALERRRLLLVAAALIGDPHLRHIAIVAAIVGYQKDEQQIEKDWATGRADAGRKYSQDLAACNGGSGL